MTDENADYQRGYDKGYDEGWDETTRLSESQLKQLVANLNPARVAHRNQGGANLSYLEAWDVRATLTRIFGFAQWSADLMEPVKIVRIDEVKRSQPTRSGQDFNYQVLALATVKVRIHKTGATYTESASASQTGPDLGEVTDFAVKTAESDAFKRACINLGTQFGLSLYNDGATADVIKVVLEPDQMTKLKAIREATAAKVQEDAKAFVDAPMALS